MRCAYRRSMAIRTLGAGAASHPPPTPPTPEGATTSTQSGTPPGWAGDDRHRRAADGGRGRRGGHRQPRAGQRDGGACAHHGGPAAGDPDLGARLRPRAGHPCPVAALHLWPRAQGPSHPLRRFVRHRLAAGASSRRAPGSRSASRGSPAHSARSPAPRTPASSPTTASPYTRSHSTARARSPATGPPASRWSEGDPARRIPAHASRGLASWASRERGGRQAVRPIRTNSNHETRSHPRHPPQTHRGHGGTRQHRAGLGRLRQLEPVHHPGGRPDAGGRDSR